MQPSNEGPQKHIGGSLVSPPAPSPTGVAGVLETPPRTYVQAVALPEEGYATEGVDAPCPFSLL